jgi:hypothetical protein
MLEDLIRPSVVAAEGDSRGLPICFWGPGTASGLGRPCGAALESPYGSFAAGEDQCDVDGVGGGLYGVVAGLFPVPSGGRLDGLLASICRLLQFSGTRST